MIKSRQNCQELSLN